jgi:hypothetical protein
LARSFAGLKFFEQLNLIDMKILSTNQSLKLAGLVLVLVSGLAISCKKTGVNHMEPGATQQTGAHNGPSFWPPNPLILPETEQELNNARSATAKYQSIAVAFADGYADIDVVRENMGFHFLKASLLDTIFDPTRPEILVYNKKPNGEFELVALEYAVPISQMPNSAPSGFTGSADVWKYDTYFGLWLLHAWVWEYNPDGVFNPTNPLVHLH